MEKYLLELNNLAEYVLNSKGQQHTESLLGKLIEGKEMGYEFIKLEPSINHLNQKDVSIENKILFEHCVYLTNLKNQASANTGSFFLGIEDDLKRALRLIYSKERTDAYFGKVERKEAVYFIFTDSVVDFIIDKAMNNYLEYKWYEQKINAKNFIKAWINFSKKIPVDKYSSNPDLTSFVLGSKKGIIEIEDTSYNLYSCLQQEFGIPLKPYREDKYSDVSIYSKYEFSNVFSLHYDLIERKDILKENHKNWFKDCLILVEHENKYLDAFTEMMYLTYRRARLKVLITYDEENTDEKSLLIFKTMSENFCNIIKQSNTLFAENAHTEYLLIVGSLREGKKIVWNTQSFLWAGQTIDKYTFLNQLIHLPRHTLYYTLQF